MSKERSTNSREGRASLRTITRRSRRALRWVRAARVRVLVDRMFTEMAQIVSARGLCARQAAALAELPGNEVERIREACHCALCDRLQ